MKIRIVILIILTMMIRSILNFVEINNNRYIMSGDQAKITR